MAKYSILQNFYASDVWINFRMFIISSRGLICEYCNTRVSQSNHVTLHHKIEINPDNVTDATISLNPDNVMIVHHACHNKIHKHCAKKMDRGVYIVYGPPLSGKKSFVVDRMWEGDLVVDMDLLYQAISLLPVYNKPDALLYNVKGIQGLLIDQIKTRYGRWDRAWIIGGYADKYRREQLSNEVGAELVYISATREQCLDRLRMNDVLKGQETQWEKYIDTWFNKYTE